MDQYEPPQLVRMRDQPQLIQINQVQFISGMGQKTAHALADHGIMLLMKRVHDQLGLAPLPEGPDSCSKGSVQFFRGILPGDDGDGPLNHGPADGRRVRFLRYKHPFPGGIGRRHDVRKPVRNPRRAGRKEKQAFLLPGQRFGSRDQLVKPGRWADLRFLQPVAQPQSQGIIHPQDDHFHRQNLMAYRPGSSAARIILAVLFIHEKIGQFVNPQRITASPGPSGHEKTDHDACRDQGQQGPQRAPYIHLPSSLTCQTRR